MIIDLEEITKEYINNSLKNQKNEEKVIDILESAFSSNYHFPKMKLKTYSKLFKKNKEENFLSRKSSANLETIYNNAVKILNEISKIPCVIKIIEESKDENRDANNFVISLERFNPTILEQSHFLVENLKDYKIYLKLSEHYLKKNNKDFFELSFYPDNGSGNEIGVQYESSFIEQKKIGICIVDSDKKYPKSEYGDTAKKILLKKREDALCEIIILDKQRELENFISLTILKILYESSFENNNKFNNILNDIDDKFYNYMDIKEGIQIKDIFDKDFFNFWKTIFKNKILNCHFYYKLSENSEPLEVNLTSFNEVNKFLKSKKFKELENKGTNFSKNEIKKIKEIIIYEGYGNNISNLFINFLENKNKLENEIEKIRAISKLSENEKAIKINKIKEKINQYNKKEDELFQNLNLKKVLEKIILWGIKIRNIEKVFRDN